MTVRKLQRTPAPACLSSFKHGANNWGDVTPEHKKEIWQQLEAMQGRFCAYCERSIRRKSKDSHIEHFVRCDNEKKKTFDWNNLFGSCEDKHTCGKHKDNKARHIKMDVVCKPDIMDPANFLQFLPGGNVQTKPGIEESKQRIAENTIAIFNLNNSSLCGRRRLVYKEEKRFTAEIFELLNLMPDEPELIEELNENIARISQQDFASARKAAWLLA